MHVARQSDPVAYAPPARRAREPDGGTADNVLHLQRTAGNRAVACLLARAPKTATPPKTAKPGHAAPWRGKIVASWNAALRSRPHKDPKKPHQGILADLNKGTEVTVVGQERGWLRAEAIVDGKKLTGYISRELVGYVGPVTVPAPEPSPRDPSQPIDFDFGVLDPDQAFVVLKRAQNRRMAMPDWNPTGDEAHELELAADTLERTNRYSVDRKTFAVSFAPPRYNSKISVTTIEDFILFVEAVENEYPNATPGEVAGEIRQIEYAGVNWETLLDSPGIDDAGRTVNIEDPANPIAQRFDIPALKATGHKLTTAFGEVDLFHVVAGVDAAITGAARAPSSAADEEVWLKHKTLTAGHGGDPRDFATWSGDIGQAYAEYIAARYIKGQKSNKLLRSVEEVAKPEELLGDIHGYIAAEVYKNTPPSVRTGWWMAGHEGTLSNILRTLYLVRLHGSPGAGSYQSFFERMSGKRGADLEGFVTARALAFARIWYVKAAKGVRGTGGSAAHALSSDKGVIIQKLLEEFDAHHADNEHKAAPQDRLDAVIARFMPMLTGRTG